MAQKTSGQRTVAKPKKEYSAAHGEILLEIVTPPQASLSGAQSAKPNGAVLAVRPTQSMDKIESHSPQDDNLWDAAIENSIDAIRELADKALADRQAGRTKKITI